MAASERRSPRRVRRALVLGACALAAARLVACTFPDHVFDYNQYYGIDASGGTSTGATGGGGTANGATGGSNAATGGGGSSGGVGGSGGSGGAQTGGTGAGGGSGGAGGSAGDPICTGTCAAVPSGWNGPVALYQGDPNSNAAACGSEYTSDVADGFTGLNAPPTCNACLCGGATGAACDAPPHVLIIDNASCSSGGWLIPKGTGTNEVPFQSGTCYPITLSAVDASAPGSTWFDEPAVVSGGTCTASGGGLQVVTPYWTSKARGCALPAPAAACQSGDACIPGAPAGFTNTCVYAPGETDCPTGSAFSHKTVVYTTVTGQRSCTACDCALPAGNCGQMEVFDAPSCSGASAALTKVGDCKTVSSGMNKGLKWTSNSNGLTCAPTGGQPQGNAYGTGAKTFCCL